ncbi:MAG: xanthine dehydrogenase family protein molybdopterin-binding subunit [Anaerolineae bacterium]
MSDIHVDVFRAVHDRTYTAKLTGEQWEALVRSPEFDELLGEYPELAADFVEANQAQLARFGFKANGNLPANPSLAVEDFSVLGQRLPRIQGLGVVTSQGRYVENMTMPDMLYQKTLRSPHPHAIVKSIDTSKAEAVPGVVDVIHRFNLSEEENARVSAGPPARYLFNEEVLQVGAPIAALVAEKEHIADEAIRLIEVEYEILPHVITIDDAIQPGTPKQWDNEFDGTILGTREAAVGDPEAGLAEADVVLETTTTRTFEQHMPLEVSAAIVWWEHDRLHMYYTSQHAHGTRDGMARWLGLPRSKVHMIQTGYMGSGYGFRSRGDLDEAHAAILARRTGRPVKRVATRSEDFVTRTHRPQFRQTVKVGVKRNGELTAITADVIANVGAQRFSSAPGSWFGYQNLYAAPNIGVTAMDVYSNTYLSGYYRCVSHPACTWALETTMDEAADAIGMDPVEFRLKNFNLEGNPFNGRPFSNPGIVTTLEKVAEKIDWQANWHPPKAKEVRPGVYHGIGIACHTCTHGSGTAGGSGMVVLSGDGSMNVISASTDIGPGERTLMAMIAAETVGVPYKVVSITPHVDTDFTSDTGGTNGSRQTNTAGWGIYQAAMDAKRQLLEAGARLFIDNAANEDPAREIEVSPDELEIKDGLVFFKDDPDTSLRVGEVVSFTNGGRSPLIGRGNHVQDPTWQRAAYATQAAEIEVDTVTGSIKVLRYVAAHDIGKALNPFALEQQIEGGVIMSLGAALTEELLVDEATGIPIGDNILEYKALSIKDVPRTIDVILVEHAREYGVYGAHGIGEPAIALGAPVIGNALYNAVGVRVYDLPITRDKVLAALKAVA